MSIKNHTDLNTGIDDNITTNGNGDITGSKLNEQLKDVADSSVNKKGDSGIEASLSYATEIELTDRKEIAHVGYVQDAIEEAVNEVGAVTSVNGQNGSVSLESNDIPENTNLYFTNQRAIDSTLTGYTSGAGSISSSDTVRTAIQKLDANISVAASRSSRVYNASFMDDLYNWNGIWTRTVTGGTVSEPSDAVLGVQSLNTGTTTTGSSSLMLGGGSSVFLGNGTFRYISRVRFTTLSNGTDTYTGVVGLNDAISNEAVDGVYFKYEQGVTGNFWVTITSQASTRTSTTTTAAIAANTWYQVEALINSAGTQVQFYVDNVLVATHTTNIPIGPANKTTTPQFWIKKSAGTTSRSMEADFWYHECNTSRLHPSGSEIIEGGTTVTQEDITELQNQIDTLNTSVSNESHAAEVILPNSIDIIEGREFNLYFDACIKTTQDLEDFDIDVACTKGKQYADYFRYTALLADVGSYSLAITVYYKGIQVATASTTLNVIAKTNGAGTTRKVLVVGDSTTDNSPSTPYSYTITEVVNLINTDNTSTPGSYSILFQGTKGSGTVKHEGHSGWAYSSFNSAISPFWNGGVLDIPNYLTSNSITMASGDWIIFDLGINDMFNPTTDVGANFNVNIVKTNADALIAGWKAAVSGIKIAIGIPICPGHTQDGFAAAYGASQYRDRYKYNRDILVKELLSYYDTSLNRSNNIYVIPVGYWLDPKNGFPITTAAISARNSTTQTYVTDCIHPAPVGYYQKADAYYSFLKGKA